MTNSYSAGKKPWWRRKWLVALLALAIAVPSAFLATLHLWDRFSGPPTPPASSVVRPSSTGMIASPTPSVTSSVPTPNIGTSVSVSSRDWYYLSDTEAVSKSYLSKSGAYSTGGDLFQNSFRQGFYVSPARGVQDEFVLGKKCTRLVATLGLDDHQETTFAATAHVVLDGKRGSPRQVSYGKPHDIDIDVTDILRIVLTADTAASTTDTKGMGSTLAYLVWGDVRVLCSEPPPAPKAQ